MLDKRADLEWVVDKYNNKDFNYKEVDSLYEKFQDSYGKKVLESTNGKDLLYLIFGNKDSGVKSLKYVLENDEDYRYFGGIKGGSSYKFTLYYSNQESSWIKGTHNKNAKKISEDEAIQEASKLRDSLCSLMSNIDDLLLINNNVDENLLTSIEELAKRYLDNLYNRGWIFKYLHMIYPYMFANMTNNKWFNLIFATIGEISESSLYSNHGKFSRIAKELNIPNVYLYQILYAEVCKQYSEKNNVDVDMEDNDCNVYGLHVVGKNNCLDKNNPHISIGWAELGDLSNVDIHGISEKFDLAYFGKYSKESKIQQVRQIDLFVNRLKKGDYVIFGDGKLAHIGVVTSDYYFEIPKEEEQKQEFVNHRKVNWLGDFYYKDLPKELALSIGAGRTIFFLNKRKDMLLDFINSKNKVSILKRERIYPLNQILYGAPGVGKTYATAEYAMAIIENRPVNIYSNSKESRKMLMEKYRKFVDREQIVFTTFHQSYGYEDFIQGLKPQGDSDKLIFKVVDGVFKSISDKAKADEDNNYVIIIDEINRGNISKIFGELITLIEEDKRWGENNQLSVTLPTKEIFTIPNNLYIIGTMNSADKSISLIDAALRRRFDFIEIIPDYDLINDIQLRNVLRRINEKLIEELESTDLLIGHSYFLNKTKNDLCNIMNRNIIPLLYEYFYDDVKKVKKLLDEVLIELPNIKVSNTTIGRVRLLED